MAHYHAFGLRISSDLKIVEFQQGDGDYCTDIQICAGEIDRSQPDSADRLLITVEEGLCFLVESGHTITYHHSPQIDQEVVRLFLLGSAFGALLQQRGHVVLHGNALTYDSKECTIVVGKRGAGKSTTAAWHYQHGAKILADDICAVSFDETGMPFVVPSFPQIKLWQTSADLLNISTQNLRRIRKNIDKFALPIIDRFCTTALPVSKIIEINSSVSPEKVLYGTEKLALLQRHSYRYNFLRRMGRQSNYTKLIISLAGKVEVRSQNRFVLDAATQLTNSL